MPVKMLEWHCGIGGVSAALGEKVAVIAAVDIKLEALEVHRQNFPHHHQKCKNIESLSNAEVAAWGTADLWWMSPPCQPHTALGNRLDMDDPRSASLKRLLRLIADLQPPNLAMENVPGFADSVSRLMLLDTLSHYGYAFAEETICPTTFGWPNRRARYYLAASREIGGLRDPAEGLIRATTLSELVDEHCDTVEELRLEKPFRDRYTGAIHIADRNFIGERTNCFTSAYGRSPTRCGSYLALPDSAEIRRFAPAEILSQLDFPGWFSLPTDKPARKLWPLVGNSLTLGATRRTLSRLTVLTGAFSR